MEDKLLEMCKKALKIQNDFSEVECIYKGDCKNCPFAFENNGGKESCTYLNKDEAIQLAQNYIKEHEKTVNTIEKIEENEDISRDLIEGNNFTKATVTLKELQEIKNNVDHPKHYTNGKYECIDIIEDVTKDLTGLEAVCTANVIKYMWRWKLKNGVEDLKKARWYLNKLIDNTEIKEIEETYQTEGMAD